MNEFVFLCVIKQYTLERFVFSMCTRAVTSYRWNKHTIWYNYSGHTHSV